jgi:glycine cleavage system H lipoate-binding protein
VYNERQSKLDDLQPREVFAGTSQHDKATTKSILYIIAGLLACALIFGIAMSYGKRKEKGFTNAFSEHIKILNEENVQIPNGVYFDKTHTWSFMEKDGSVTVGIDDFMQQVTGKYTNVKMKNPGDRITKNEPLVTLVQDGKQIEIHAPISGKIKEINEDLITDPSEINNSPYSKGWIYSIEPSNWQREISFMKMADSYKNWMKKEIERLKDFLAVIVNAENKEQVAYQDGGELSYNVLKDFGPRVWEDFQKNFIETSDLN